MRWWWNGNRLSEKEILRELDLLKEAGIGGVEINPIKFPETAGQAGYEAYQWLSDDWIRMLKTALQGAEERGLVCDSIVGSGWPFGGEFLEREDQTQLLTIGTRKVSGPGTLQLDAADLLGAVSLDIHSRYDDLQKELFLLRLAPLAMDTFGAGTDIAYEPGQERIPVEVPEGEHILYYVVKFTGFQAVINGAPGADGPVLNHYNKAATEKYLDRMSGKLSAALGGLTGFRAMFCDSMELEGANWDRDFPEQFEQRRGYSLLPYLPFVLFKIGHMGNPVEEGDMTRLTGEALEQIQRVRYDFYTTCIELVEERFLQTFQDWCTQNKVKARVQAYGREFHPIEASMKIDLPECETWIGPSIGEVPTPEGREGRAYTMINKFVSSGARLAGKKLVSCEEITNTGMVFNATLEKIKIAGDQSNLSGVTHSILHGFNYSPPDAPFPGWVRYGTFFNERNPWWPYLRKWTDYKARLSAVFQQAELFADIAIMHPLADMWMKHGPQRDPFPVIDYPSYQHIVWEAVHQNGNACDYISENILQQAEPADGELRYGPRSYKVLILLAVETILPDTARALAAFAKAGGTIVFVEKEPRRSPGFLNSRENDRQVAASIAGIKREYAGNVFSVPAPGKSPLEWYRDMQQTCGIKPVMEIESPAPFVSQVCYRAGERDIFFVVNYSRHDSFASRVYCRGQEGKTAWVWDPETGERALFARPNKAGGLSLVLGPAGSLLLVFDKEDGEAAELPENHPDGVSPEPPNAYEVEGPWSLALQHAQEEPARQELPALKEFREDETLRAFAGQAVYEKEIDLAEPGAYRYLDLGKVHGISEVTLNGRELGTRWYGNHRYTIPEGLLQQGSNQLRITLTVTLGNYLKSLKENKTARVWTSRQDWQPAGMLGPVKLL